VSRELHRSGAAAQRRKEGRVGVAQFRASVHVSFLTDTSTHLYSYCNIRDQGHIVGS